MYFLENFNAQALKSKYLFFGALCLTWKKDGKGWEIPPASLNLNPVLQPSFLKCDQVVSGK